MTRASRRSIRSGQGQAAPQRGELQGGGSELLVTPIVFMVMDKEMSEVVTPRCGRMWGCNAKLETLEYLGLPAEFPRESAKGLRWTDPTSVYNDPDGMM